jgi:outer membrane protein assembly factor BamD (BamD/ComL family)
LFRPFQCLPILALISLLCVAQSSTDKLESHEAGSKPIASDAPPNSSLLGEANAFYRAGNFSKAITKYKELLQDKPTSPARNAVVYPRLSLWSSSVDRHFDWGRSSETLFVGQWRGR